MFCNYVNYFSFVPFCIGWVENFDEITHLPRLRRQKQICFFPFLTKFEIQNGRHFWGGENFLEIAKSTFKDTLWVKIFTKWLQLARLRRWKQICVLPFFAKISKFKMAAIFGEGKNF